jgi:hypothetical protein
VISSLNIFTRGNIVSLSWTSDGLRNDFPRKGAKAQRKPVRNAAALCAFAPLREKSSFCPQELPTLSAASRQMLESRYR